MPDMRHDALDPRRQSLLQKKLGALLTWTKPAIAETVGPFDPSIFDKFDSARRGLIAECSRQLERYDDHIIDILVQDGRNANEAVLSEWRRYKDLEIDKLLKREPPWYAAGYGHVDHEADFDYWSKMRKFTVDEVLCLSVGIEPEEFPSARLNKMHGKQLASLWPALQFLLRRRDQFKRMFDPGHNNWTVKPKDFIAWVEQVDLECHPEFLRLLRKYHAKGPETSTVADGNKPADKREIDTMAKLFVLMAIDWLGYDPRAGKSPIPKQIVELAAKKGISVTEDTVRKYLRRGAKFIADED